MMTSLVDARALSLAVSRRVYTPAAEKVAVVLSALEALNVTVPGPLTLLHMMVSAPGGLGSPSSVAVPVRLAAFGSVIVWLAPALTTGALLPGTPPSSP